MSVLFKKLMAIRAGEACPCGMLADKRQHSTVTRYRSPLHGGGAGEARLPVVNNKA